MVRSDWNPRHVVRLLRLFVDRHPRPSARDILAHWRVLVFLLLALASLVVGFIFKTATSPIETAQSIGEATPGANEINVFTSDPGAHVKCAVVVVGGQGKSQQVGLYLKIEPSAPGLPVNWIATVNGPAQQAPSADGTYTLESTISPIPPYGEPLPPPSLITVLSGNLQTIQDRHLEEPQSSQLGLTRVGQLTVFPFERSAVGQYAARYPSLEADALSSERYQVDVATAPLPPGAAPQPAAFTPPILAISAPHPIGESSTFDAVSPTERDYPTQPLVGAPFFVPTDISTNELVLGGSELLRDSQTNSMVPSDAQERGDDLLWQATGALQPSISTTAIDYLETRSAHDFYAGIAFAVAAAAIIALLQERRRGS